ncbi:MAG: conjugal transfer protein TraU [Chromatiaceae bacterium]|nr:MAG: conjugal transfer protein TraU [Chromatiaceae bacterium]
MSSRQPRSRLVGVVLLFAAGLAQGSDPTCSDAQVFSGKLITDVCWACLFPVKIAGIRLFGQSTPPGASNANFCTCNDPLGVPRFGFAVGLWEPARLVELVQSPRCSMVLGGIRLPLGSRRLMGETGDKDGTLSSTAFYNYHWYAFPLLVLLDLFLEDRCNPDGYTDVDVLYLSELDPTWNHDELALFTNPEVVAFANPVAQAACLADAVAATAGHPLDHLFWCAGTWGGMYPFSGHQTARGPRARATSLWAARSTAALHRRGLARRTMGDQALCESPIAMFIPKSQYKLSMFYPLPQTSRAHVIGESTFTWGGEQRNIPGTGEDHIYLLWRWNDCCLTF